MAASVTTKIILDTRYKKASGRYPVRLRVTFNGIQKYYSVKGFTDHHEFTLADWRKMNGARPANFKDPLIELNKIEDRARGIIKKMPVFRADSFELFKNKFDNNYDTSTIEDFISRVITELENRGQIGTAINYRCAKVSFEKFRPSTYLSNITPKFLEDYESWMLNQDRSTSTVSIYVRVLRTIIRRAIREGELPETSYPFGNSKYQVPDSRNIKKALTPDEIKKIFNYKATGITGWARDFWFFLYLCNGMNSYDACRLKYSDINGDTIEYKRKKTTTTKRKQKQQVVYIDDIIRGIIKEHGNKVDPDNYIFPVLTKGLSPAREKQLVQQHTHWVNNHMKIIAKDLGIKKPCTTMYARHSFATRLRNSGAPTELISEFLGHDDIKTTRNYLDSFESETKKEALKNLTSFLK